jgi:hypothetical protein
MFGPLSPEEAALIARLPRITRAREHRLYAADGNRWLDCWADGGRALLGHRPKGLSLRLKNEIDRGLYAPYPGLWEGRLEKTLLKMFPGYSGVRIFLNARRAAEVLGLRGAPVDPLDLPAVDSIEQPVGEKTSAGGTVGGGPVVLWGRPLLPGHPPADYLFPIVPLPGLTEVQPVLFRDTSAEPRPSDPVSPVILAAMNRSCASVITLNAGSGNGNSPISSFNADIWDRRGPYMMFRGSEVEYTQLFEKLFSLRVLIAPSGKRGSIIPMGLSSKESALLAAGGFSRT